MEENVTKTEENVVPVEVKSEVKEEKKSSSNQTPIVSAIIIAGVLIAAAILLKGSKPIPQNVQTNAPVASVAPAAVGPTDRIIGDQNAKVTLIAYEDFQCPWCGKFVNESEQVIRNKYVKNGSVRLVYRDFAFLGSFVQPYVAAKDESINSAEAARCAGDQGQFWQYHDYLFSHQNGEDQGAFSIANLKTFAGTLGLDKTSFAQCLDSGKYAKAVADSKAEGEAAGVTGTPKVFILVNGKVVDSVDGYLPLSAVTAKIDAALKD
jgi:protein-disulfide isomerase